MVLFDRARYNWIFIEALTSWVPEQELREYSLKEQMALFPRIVQVTIPPEQIPALHRPSPLSAVDRPLGGGRWMRREIGRNGKVYYTEQFSKRYTLIPPNSSSET